MAEKVGHKQPKSHKKYHKKSTTKPEASVLANSHSKERYA